MNTQTRFVNRLGDHVKTGDYGYSIEHFSRRMPASEKCLYIASVIALAVVAMAIIFRWEAV